jgi:hypothetical protein
MKVSGQLHALATIIPVPIEQDDRQILEPMCALRTTQKFVAPARNEAPAHPVHSPVTNRLQYLGFGILHKIKVKMFLYLVSHNVIKTCGGVEVQLHLIFVLALGGGY